MDTKIFKIKSSADAQQIAEAAEILRRGGLLAIPTETVYGLGANGLNSDAVRRIFEAKGRPQDNPLILHIPDASWLERYCEPVPETAYLLAEHFWPGPLTMILPRKAVVPDRTTGGLDTVGMRCPRHEVTLALIRAADVPVAAPSANLSGRPSCTTAAHVLEDMSGKIDGIVDGGDCAVGVESTIIDLTVQPPRLLRPGGLPLEALREVLGEVTIDRAVVKKLEQDEKPRAPGMKYRHYAPKAPVTVVTGDGEKSARAIARRVNEHCGVICFDEFADRFPACIVHCLGSMSDKEEQARRVFDALRSFDATDVTEIYAQCPDTEGLGLAVGNRLKKAAGFRVLALPPAGKTVIGITGLTGAGKTSVLEALKQLGACVIDCDALYGEMLKTNVKLKAALCAAFGAEIFDENGLRRKVLAERVFRSDAELEKLNTIVYELLPEEVLRRVNDADETMIGIDAVNLLECSLRDFCDLTVAVTASEEQRVRRIMQRDGIDETAARLRIAAQRTDAYYTERCDYTIVNNAATPEEALADAKNILAGICRKQEVKINE